MPRSSMLFLAAIVFLTSLALKAATSISAVAVDTTTVAVGVYSDSGTNYAVYRDNFGVVGGSTLNSGANSFYDFNLPPNSTFSNVADVHYYTIFVYDQDGSYIETASTTVVLPMPLPNAPEGIQATLSNEFEISLSFTESTPYTTGFYVERAIGNGNFYPLPGLLWYWRSGNLVNFADTPAPFGSNVTYRIAALSDYGRSEFAYSYAFTVPFPTPPQAPNSLSATLMSTGVQLNWFVAYGNHDFATIQRSEDNGATFSTIGDVRWATSFSDTVTSSGPYIYRVFTNTDYGVTSGYSNPSQPITIVPPTPTYLNCSYDSNSNRIQLNWALQPFSPFDAPISITIERTDNGTDFRTLQLACGQNEAFDYDLTFPGPHQYRINSTFGNITYSMMSNVIDLSMNCAPSNFQCVADSTSSMQASFSFYPYNQIYFEIQRSADGGTNWEASPLNSHLYIDASSTASGLTGATFSDKDLMDGTMYSYRIRAAYANNGYSDWVSAGSVVYIPPKAPTNLVAVGHAGLIELRWTNNSQHYQSLVLERTNQKTGSRPLINLGIGTNSYVDTTVVFEEKYSYVIRAVSNGLDSSPAGPADASPLQAQFVKTSGDSMTGALSITGLQAGLNVQGNAANSGDIGVGGAINFKDFGQLTNRADITAYGTPSNALAIVNRNPGPFVLGTNGAEQMRINASGNVGIGVAMPTEKLEVNGGIKCKDLKVTLDGWPDYVFDPNYKLTDLKLLEQRVKADRHLPGIPSADTVSKDGLSIPSALAKHLEKIEELTLYVIKLNKEQETAREREENLLKLCKELAKQNRELKDEIDSIKKRE